MVTRGYKEEKIRDTTQQFGDSEMIPYDAAHSNESKPPYRYPNPEEGQSRVICNLATA